MIDFTLVFKEQSNTNPKQFSMKLAVESGLSSGSYSQVGTSNLNLTDATPTQDIISNAGLDTNVWYSFDVFVGSVSNSNKLDITAHVIKESSTAITINIVDNETGCVIAINAGSSNSGGIINNVKTYLAVNVEGTDLTPESDFSVSKASLKTFLLKWKDYYTSYTKYNGMMRARRAFLTLVSYDPVMFDNNGGASICWRGDTNYGFSLNSDFCCTFWDVYKMFTGEFYFPPQYFNTLDGKIIYTTLQVTPGVEEYILNQDTSILDPSKIGCKPLVCNDYQTGTNLGKFIKPDTTPTPILLKNGTVMETKSLTAPVSSTNFRWYPYVNVRNQVDPENIVDITSYTNLSMNVGSGWGDAFIGRSSQSYANNMKLFNYDNTFLAYGNKPGTIGPYIICSSAAEDGGVSNYIDENEAQGASFWNTFPSAPLTIGYLMNINWTDSGLADVIANLEEALGVTTLKGAQLVTQQLGFYGVVGTAANPNWNRITAVGVNGSAETGLTTAEGYILPFSGNFTVGSADNTRVLWGISSAIDPGGPVGPGGAIGGGSHGSHAGGSGSYNDGSDSIRIPSIPVFADTAAYTQYYLGAVEGSTAATKIAGLVNWINTTNIFTSFEERLQGIQSLKVVYSPTQPHVGSAEQLTIRGSDAGFTAEPNDRYDRISFGSFTIPEYFGSFLDYDGYTTVQIYLPFAGIFDLDTSLVVGGVECELHAIIDYYTGDIVYTITVAKDSMESVIYTISGNCSCELPLTATDYSNKISGAIQIGLGAAAIAAATIATEGAAAPAAAATSQAMIGGAAGIGSGTYQIAKQSSKKSIGQIGSNKGIMSVRYPYLIITRPKMVQADDYGEIYGYPCMKSYKLANVSEYVLVADWHPAIPGATKEEIDEIDSLLKTEGIIL